MQIKYITPDEYDEDIEALLPQVDQLHRDVELYTTRDKALAALAVEGGQVLGALYLTDNVDEFDFDVLVSPQHQGNGVGRTLVTLAMDTFAEHREINPEITTHVRVLHPAMRTLMYQHGFVPVADEPLGNMTDIHMHYRDHSPQNKAQLVKLLNKPTLDNIERHIKPINHLLTFAQIEPAINAVMHGQSTSEEALKALTHYALSYRQHEWPRELLLLALNEQRDDAFPLPTDLSHRLLELRERDPATFLSTFSDVAQQRLDDRASTQPLIEHIEALQVNMHHLLTHGGGPFAADDVPRLQTLVETLDFNDGDKCTLQRLLSHNIHATPLPTPSMTLTDEKHPSLHNTTQSRGQRLS